MLHSNSSRALHSLQNLSLIALSLAFLPLNTYIALGCYFWTRIFGSNVDEERFRNQVQPSFRRRTILVTGVGMTKGLTLARTFYLAGHRIIGADFEPNGTQCPGRLSRSLTAFYRLQQPSPKSNSYVNSLMDIVIGEHVDLWVSCSGVASAVEDAQAREIIEEKTNCGAIQFGVKLTKTLHEKHTFIEYVADQAGLDVPDTHTITSHLAVERVLRNAPSDRKYIMKTIGVVDAVRADMTLLPKTTAAETSRHLARLPISEDIPWILQEYINGPEYCTHAVVVKGEVRAFVACPSAELLMHYEALPTEYDLSRAMLNFTHAVARAGGSDFTGHLSFDFMVPKPEIGMKSLAGVQSHQHIQLYPIECNPRAHTAVALFNGTAALTDAYLSATKTTNKSNDKHMSVNEPRTQHTDIVVPASASNYYWIGHDLVTLLLLPSLSFLLFGTGPGQLLHSYQEFFVHLLSWRDGTFETWDPLPFWLLYQVYWPLQFLNCLLTGKKWSRINVSTLKMFEC